MTTTEIVQTNEGSITFHIQNNQSAILIDEYRQLNNVFSEESKLLLKDMKERIPFVMYE